MAVGFMTLTVWCVRIAFVAFVLAAYACQRQLEKKRKEVELLGSAPSCLMTIEKWQAILRPKKEEASRLRNRRDLLLGLALLNLLVDLWLI